MKNLDLIDWTMQEARQLSPRHYIPNEPMGTPSLNRLLEVLEGERVEPNSDDKIVRITPAPTIQLIGDSSKVRPTSEVTVDPKPNNVSDLPLATQAAPSSAANVAVDPKLALLRAIVDPDFYTLPIDRDRAIVLRWVLRDIKSNRLKWWPVNQPDLQDLIDMGLVEIRNDAPVLTNTGVNATI